MDKIYLILLNWQVLYLQVQPCHFFIIFLKQFKFSADFNSFGKQFYILSPMTFRLLEAKAT